MQIENKKQLPVLIALSLVLVLSIGYSIKRSMGVLNPSKPKGAETVAVTPDGGKEPLAKPETTDESTDEGPSIEFVGNPPRDPFEPRLLGASSSSGRKFMLEEARKPSNITRTSKGVTAKIPPVSLPGLGNFNTGSAPSFEMAPTSPNLQATGIVRGSHNIAILRGEGGGRYFVKEGQTVGDGYVVTMISPSGVVLKKNNRREFLKLGGEDAKTDERPRPEQQ